MPISSPPPVYESRPDVGMTLTPYLQLSHRLSLTWLAYPILSILFIIFRLILSGDAAQSAIGNARGDLLTACVAAQEAAASAASMPRYMALASNELVVKTTNAALDATRQALVLALTIMEAIINFIIDTYRSTFLCFLELIVRGALSVIISATQEVSNLLHSTATDLRTTIQNSVSGINSAISAIVDQVNKINPFGNITAPHFDVPDLSALENVTIPADFTNALTQLNSSLPSPAQLKNGLEDVIDTPFELVKKEINDTFLGFNFNSSVLPVPDRATVSFCDQMDTSIVDDLGKALVQMTRIGIIILIVLAVLLLVGNCLWEWYKWRSLKRNLQLTREAWMTDPAVVHIGSGATPSVDLSDHNLLMLASSSEHPLITRAANQISAFFRLSPSKNINLRWFMHYIFHPPALACFLIGLFGLVSVQIQLLALRPLEARFQQQALASANDFSTTVSSAMNTSMYNQSAVYANGVNAQLDIIQQTINNGMFGWVNGTTTTLNNTIATFYSDVQNIVSAVFGNTPLAQPAQEFIACFIGSKVDAVESVLTFLNENLQVNVTRVNQTVLILSPDHVDEVAQPIARAAIGGGDGSSGSGLVGRLINTYADSLRKERIMFAIFLGLWIFVVLMGLAIIFWHSYGRDILERQRFRRFQREHRSGFETTIVPFKETTEKQQDTGPPRVELRSFTPIPLSAGGREASEGLAARFATAMGKSFDSFFDRDAESTTRPSPPSRLGALGRRFTMRSRASPADSEKAVAAPEGTSAPWWARFRFPYRRPSSSDFGSVTTASSKRLRRPKLTISPEVAESVRNSTQLPVIETTSPSDEGAPEQEFPRSAWSTSPSPALPVKPWLSGVAVVPTHQQTQMLEPVVARRKPSVPDDVTTSMDDISPLATVPQQQLEIPVALHNAFPMPPSRARYVVQPPPASHHSFGPPGILQPPRLHDPFATPFDDENALRAPNSLGGRYPVVSPVRNPFADVTPHAF
ncbi:hypothetical protein K488DRAFT_90359 [Vararia minispora EC-137]|uniref:Uncharacterized protein n=1 Tax=Vararia minispora EC-137 TaxID=1314806 RepID=A0ACB8Q7X1_9AGAM|nr:hypothetical protein K488DRAFT_90359 [Vararia minispora EC-137]